jgi:hypothetical protein
VIPADACRVPLEVDVVQQSVTYHNPASSWKISAYPAIAVATIRAWCRWYSS